MTDKKIREIICTFKGLWTGQCFRNECCYREECEETLSQLKALKPKIDKVKLITVIDDCIGDTYQAGFVARSIIIKAEEIIK